MARRSHEEVLEGKGSDGLACIELDLLVDEVRVLLQGRVPALDPLQNEQAAEA